MPLLILYVLFRCVVAALDALGMSAAATQVVSAAKQELSSIETGVETEVQTVVAAETSKTSS